MCRHGVPLSIFFFFFLFDGEECSTLAVLGNRWRHRDERANECQWDHATCETTRQIQMPVPFLQHQSILNDGAIRHLVIGLTLRSSIPTDSPFLVSIRASQICAPNDKKRGTRGNGARGGGRSGRAGMRVGWRLELTTIKLGTHSHACVTSTHLTLGQVSDMEYMLQRR